MCVIASVKVYFFKIFKGNAIDTRIIILLVRVIIYFFASTSDKTLNVRHSALSIVRMTNAFSLTK